jgi:hypothetical protein
MDKATIVTHHIDQKYAIIATKTDIRAMSDAWQNKLA